LNTSTSTTTETPPATTRPTRRTARERFVRLLAGYLPVLPAEARAAVLAALPVSEASTTGAAGSAPAWKWIKIRDTRRYPTAPIFWAAFDVFDAPISPSAKLVELALIAAHCGHSEQVRVPIQRLAAMTGLPEAEVRRAVAELLAAGRFHLDKRGGAPPGPAGSGGPVAWTESEK
jgi:hypothetical protein